MSDDNEYDPSNVWQLQDGMFSEYRVDEVTEAAYTFRSNYQNGEALLLELVMSVDEEIDPKGVREEIWPCGKGWDQDEDGETCKLEDGRAAASGRGTYFNKGSGTGILFEHMQNAEGFAELGMGNPYLASSWIGLGMDLTTWSGSYKNKKNETIEYTRMVPKRVWWAKDGAPDDGEDATPTAPAKPPTTAKKAAAKAPATKKAATPPPTAAATEAPAETAKQKAARLKAEAAAGTTASDSDIPGLIECREIANRDDVSDHATFMEIVYTTVQELMDDPEGEGDAADLVAIVDDPAKWDFS